MPEPSEPSVDALRDQLRERGYLSHGFERWFALDLWSSRTFWVELAVVALKAATLIAAFGALPHTAIMLFRNAPVSAADTMKLFVLYWALWFAGAFLFVIVIALLMKIRPELAVDTPRALLAISIAAAALAVSPLAGWWWMFGGDPSPQELAVGGGLIALLFVVAALVISAALLSFSIYELHRIPAIHQRPRTVPLAAAAAALIALLFVPARATESAVLPPDQVVTRPVSQRLALVAVDGLTWEIARSRPDLLEPFTSVQPLDPIVAPSATERWASLGTGVPARLHGVRALAGVRLEGSERILQEISPVDFVLLDFAPAIGLAERQPLPPTVRRRHFIWESLANRGVPVVAVNWWTSASETSGALTSIGQETIYGASRGEPLRVDGAAIRRLQAAAEGETKFATIYLPALDVILNRVGSDRGAQLAASLRAIDGIAGVVGWLRSRGYEVVLAGMPGEGQGGRGIMAASIELDGPAHAWDVAPTLAQLAGFPDSREMPGRSLAPGDPLPPITTYGERSRSERATSVDREYYESLRSLGYIR